MKRLWLFLMLAVVGAQAQYTTVSGSKLQDLDGTKLTGQVCFAPANNKGLNIGFRVGGGGQATVTKKCTSVTNGGFTISLADTALTNPANVCYMTTAMNAKGEVVLGPKYGYRAGQITGYECVQPTGATWSFDDYTPAGQPGMLVVAGPVGPQGPRGYSGVGAVEGLTSDGDKGIVVEKKIQASSVAVEKTMQVPLLRTGRSYLQSWQGIIGKITNTMAGSSTGNQAVIAAFGDSWTARQNGHHYPALAQALQARYGNGGVGWVSFSTHDWPPDGASRTSQGTWNETAKAVGSKGLDAADSTSTDTATPAKRTISAIATDIYVHYIKYPGGGDFTYQIDGGTPTTVHTASSGTELGVVAIRGLANASHALSVTVTAAGSSGVTLTGAEFRIAGSGIRLNQCGDSGSTASDFANTHAATWQSGLAQLNPDLVILGWAVNEKNKNESPSSQVAALTALITRIRAAVPKADILLMPDGDSNALPTTYLTSDYVEAQASLASRAGVAFFSPMDVIGSYASAQARGLYGDEDHLNSDGGQVLANALASFLVGGNTAASNEKQQFASVGIGMAPGSDPLSLVGNIAMFGGGKIYDGPSNNSTGLILTGGVLTLGGANGINLTSSAASLGAQSPQISITPSLITLSETTLVQQGIWLGSSAVINDGPSNNTAGFMISGSVARIGGYNGISLSASSNGLGSQTEQVFISPYGGVVFRPQNPGWSCSASWEGALFYTSGTPGAWKACMREAGGTYALHTIAFTVAP